MKVVVTEPHLMNEQTKGALASLGNVTYGPFTSGQLFKQLSDCDVLVVRLGHFIGAEIIAHASNLRFIVSATTGLDHIDLAATKSAGVEIVSLRGCANAIQDVSATAEHTWGLLLALVRNIPAAANHVLAGGWDRNRFWGSQLRGRRLGIVGHGRIGGMMARYGEAFGMDVVACDREPDKVVEPASNLPLSDIIQTSDVVSIHVTASPANSGFISRELIARMKHSAVVLNTARGSLVDEVALAEAIAEGRIAGAAVDVLIGEEKGNSETSPLLRLARAGHNVLITPHIGGATREAIESTEAAVVDYLLRLLKEHAGNSGEERKPNYPDVPITL